jgi:hypothetical protein
MFTEKKFLLVSVPIRNNEYYFRYRHNIIYVYNIMNHFILVISSLFLLTSLFFINFIPTKLNYFELSLTSLLVINVILSILFWSEPIKGSSVHYYDAIFARISLVLFSLYIWFVKKTTTMIRATYTLVLSASLLFIYFSNVFSQKKWCSSNHIICHFMFHVFISIGTIFAFV